MIYVAVKSILLLGSCCQVFVSCWGGILVSPCPSVCPSVCRRNSCPVYNFHNIECKHFNFGMQIVPREKVCRVLHQLNMRIITLLVILSTFDLFRIHEANCNARAFKFYTNVVVKVTFAINSGFC